MNHPTSAKKNGLLKAASALVAVVLASTVMAGPAHAAVTITGSGSTAVKNLLDVCIPDYLKASGNTVVYAGGGSGAGRLAFTAGTVDFAFSDAAYGSTEAKPADFVYVPNVAFPIAIMINLPGFSGDINLSAKTLSAIYAGKITVWNDKAIVADNNKTVKEPVYSKEDVISMRAVIDPKTKKAKKDKKGKTVMEKYVSGTKDVANGTKDVVVEAKLPATPITVWYRSDKSGSTGILTNWMTKLDPTVWTKAGSAGQQTFTSAFPADALPAGTFQGGQGSDGVANGVASKDGSIGYAETSYATERKLLVAKIQNGAGEYVSPTPEATAVFLNNFASGARGTVVVDVASKVSGAYTLSSFSYGLGYGSSAKDKTKQAAVKEFMTYVLTTCATANAVTKGYSPVSGALAAVAVANIAEIG
ncbi:MAG: substrate-binding domain-containing protein [Actinomycetes bacterium]